MTSKKGANEDTKKTRNIARRGPEKEVLKLESFLLFLFGGGKGCAGIWEGPSVGGGGSSAGDPWRETSSSFLKNRGF